MEKTIIERKKGNPEYRRLFQQEKLLLEAQALIVEAMDAAEISRAELARRMNVTRGYITQVLSGKNNPTLRSFADFMTVLNAEAVLSNRALAHVHAVQRVWRVYDGDKQTLHVRFSDAPSSGELGEVAI